MKLCFVGFRSPIKLCKPLRAIETLRDKAYKALVTHEALQAFMLIKLCEEEAEEEGFIFQEEDDERSLSKDLPRAVIAGAHAYPLWVEGLCFQLSVLGQSLGFT